MSIMDMPLAPPIKGSLPPQKKKRTHQHVCPIGEPFISGPFRANPNLPRDCGQHHRHGTPWSLHPEVARRKVIIKHQKKIQNTEVLSQKDMILPKITSQKMANLKYPAKRHVSSW